MGSDVTICSFKLFVVRLSLGLLILLSGLGNLGQIQAAIICRSVVHNDATISVDCTDPELVHVEGGAADSEATAASSSEIVVTNNDDQPNTDSSNINEIAETPKVPKVPDVTLDTFVGLNAPIQAEHIPDLGARINSVGSLQPNIDAQHAGLTYQNTTDNKQVTVKSNVDAQGAGLTYQEMTDSRRVTVNNQYSKLNGLVLGGGVATLLSRDFAMGVLFTVGSEKNEWLLNTGLNITERQRVIASLGQLRQKFDFGFVSGMQKTQVTQDNVALSYQYLLGRDWLNATEVDAYVSNTNSIKLTDKTYSTDTNTLYELWNESRRIAGARVSGAQGKLVLTPTTTTSFKVGLGLERLTYDYLTGKDTVSRATSSTELNQRLGDNLDLRASANIAAAQNRYTLGLAHNDFGGGRLGMDVVSIQGRDGTLSDSQLFLNYTHNFGGVSRVTQPLLNTHPLNTTHQASVDPAPTGSVTTASRSSWDSPLLDRVARRPSVLPAQVVAKVDTTTTATRLIAVDKGLLPAGSTVALATGIVTAPINAAIGGIAGVTLAAGGGSAIPFTNTGQFTLSGVNLVINPNLMTQPITTDVYVVTMNNVDGGTTLATVRVIHGSTRIESVVMSSGTPAPVALEVKQTVAYNASVTAITLVIVNTPTSVTVASAASHGTATASGTTITYTPTTGYSGQDTFTYTATNAAGTSSPATATITVSAPTLTALPAAGALTGGVVGVAYSKTLSASGGASPYTTAVTSGTLPAGITLSGNALSGTPLTAGSYNFTITTTDTSTGAHATVATAYSLVMTTATISAAAIAGVTAPVVGATPVTTITAGTGYTGTVAWSGSPVTFAGNTAYTATITLTATSGYTLTGVTANFFTVSGATPVTNSANSGTVSAAFPTTAASVSLPTGYIASGGLVWAPIQGKWNGAYNTLGNGWQTWSTTNTACNAKNVAGYTSGWRMASRAELIALYAARNTSISPAGWPPTNWTGLTDAIAVKFVWTSTSPRSRDYYFVNMSTGTENGDGADNASEGGLGSCVHAQ